MSRPTIRPAVPLLLVALLAAASAPAGQETAPPPAAADEGAAPAAAPAPASPSFHLVVQELMVEVTDDDGRTPRDLTAADLAVEEGGEARPILELSAPVPPPAAELPAPAGGPWRVTVYFDSLLCADPTVGRAARVLEERAAALAALGWVEVVVADPDPRLALPATRDRDQISTALGRIFLLEQGRDRLVSLREEALAAVAAAPATGAERDAVLAAAVTAEATLVRERQDALLAWLADRPGGGPRALLWVTDGFDLDPAAALRDRLVGSAEGGAVYPPPAPPALAAPTEDLARAVAAAGWVVMPLVPRLGVGADPSRWGVAFEKDLAGRDAVLGKVTLPRRKSAAEKAEEQMEAERAAAEPPPPSARDPLTALGVVATATGGGLVTDPQGLTEAFARLAGRVRLRYSAARPPGGGPEPLQVRVLRRGLTVRAPAWVGWSTPEAVAALRARRLLAGEPVGGELAVASVLEVPPGPEASGSDTQAGAESGSARLEARITVPAPAFGGVVLPPLVAAAPRVTVVTEGPGGEAVLHRRAIPVPAGAGADAGGGWRLAVPLDLPAALLAGVERVAVVVEDLPTGLWGGTLAGLVHVGAAGGSGAPGVDAAAEDLANGDGGDGPFDADLGLLPAPRVVNLVQPEARMLRGQVRLETVVSDPAVARVEFRVDGRRAAVAERAPFAAVVDLGKLPLPRRVEAVAYDAGGAVLGRDAMLVNEGGRGFAVRITEPTVERREGPVEVAAEVSHPEGDRVERVEFYWNDRRVATLFRPPYRARLVVPPESPQGFIRVAAFLADGTSAEDVRLLNGSGASGRVEVNLVELYVVVSGADGRPVKGLGVADFAVSENGAPQKIAGVSDAGDLPVTVGLAIDSSASMFVKLAAVQEAANHFLAGLTAGRDHAFLVDFDDRPHLAEQPTRDLDRVASAVSRLQAGGQTSLWESVVYSLVQLQGVRGRKALIVYSDGADEDKGFSYRTCLRFARKVGIPIYVIVSNNEAVRTDWLGIRSLGDRVERLTSSVGGKAYLVRSGDDLSAIYREIEDELRSQYLVTFYSQDPPAPDEWRDVQVGVRGPGLTARTVSGYQL